MATSIIGTTMNWFTITPGQTADVTANNRIGAAGIDAVMFSDTVQISIEDGTALELLKGVALGIDDRTRYFSVSADVTMYVMGDSYRLDNGGYQQSAPAAVTNLTGDVDSGKAFLSWDGTTQADNYIVTAPGGSVYNTNAEHIAIVGGGGGIYAVKASHAVWGDSAATTVTI